MNLRMRNITVGASLCLTSLVFGVASATAGYTLRDYLGLGDHTIGRDGYRATLTASQSPAGPVTVLDAQCDGLNVSVWLSDDTAIVMYPVAVCPATVALYIGSEVTMVAVTDVSAG